MEYNKEELFNTKIKPLRDEFMRECALAQIPSFVTSAIKDEDGKTTYDSDMVSALTNDITLSDDKITKMANVLNDFNVVETNKTIEFDM